MNLDSFGRSSKEYTTDNYNQVNKKMNEGKNMEKLLGKKGLEKYRQRMNEKFKSEISTLTTRYNMTFTSN